MLTGKYNPSGKLPVSFPRAVGQEPLYYNRKNTGRPYSAEHVTYSHYTDIENGALYPFGFGLSYTNFEYAAPKLTASSINAGGSSELSVAVTNSGSVKGKEVVQLYLHDLVATTARPIKELKGFEMVELEPGETKTVTFTIDEEMLQFYTAAEKWEAEEGEFEVMVGGNSEDLKTLKFNYTK